MSKWDSDIAGDYLPERIWPTCAVCGEDAMLPGRNYHAKCGRYTCSKCDLYAIDDCVPCFNDRERERITFSCDGQMGRGLDFYCPYILCHIEGAHTHHTNLLERSAAA